MKTKLILFFSLFSSFFYAQVIEQRFEYYQTYDSVTAKYNELIQINVVTIFNTEQKTLTLRDPQKNEAVFTIAETIPEAGLITYKAYNTSRIPCTIQMYTEGNKHVMEIKYSKGLKFKTLTKFQ